MNKRIISLCLVLVIASVLVPGLAQARYLSPSTGRFQTMDSYEGNSSDPLSLHKYTYCHENPVSGIDPSGREIENIVTAMNTAWSLSALSSMGQTLMRATGIGYAGPDVTRSIVDHLNDFISQVPVHKNPILMLPALLRYATSARQNGWGGPLGRAVLASPGFNGTVTFGDMVISAYHIDHILVLSYIGVCYGEVEARAAGQMNESMFLGQWNQGASFETIGPDHDMDLTFNEVAIKLLRHMEPNRHFDGALNPPSEKRLSIQDVLEVTKSVTQAQRATIANKPSMRVGIRGYQNYHLNNQPIPSPTRLSVPALEL
jgi:hypothetical protein